MITSKGFRNLGLAALMITCLYGVVTLTPWSSRLCSEENKGQSYSPDGSYLARVYERNCGATTGFLTHVNLRRKWSYFNTVWAGTIKHGQVFSIDCRADINLVWKGNNELEIQYRPRAKRGDDKSLILLRLENWEDIKIRYVEMSDEKNGLEIGRK